MREAARERCRNAGSASAWSEGARDVAEAAAEEAAAKAAAAAAARAAVAE